MSTEVKDFRNRDYINTDSKKELEYWCEKYNIVPEEIKKTINEVGSLVKDVEKRLRKKIKPKGLTRSN
jgi:hypothetical protein